MMHDFPEDPAILPARLENMRPGQVRDAIRRGAPCLLPIGTLESVAKDIPLGTDAQRAVALWDMAADRDAVLAPPIWYAPTGFVLSGPDDGTFDMPANPFRDYLREVLLTITECGFRTIEIVLMNNPQDDAGVLARTCEFVQGDLFNDLWQRPELGEGWWSRPEREELDRPQYGICKLTGVNPAKVAPDLSDLPLRLEEMSPSQFRRARQEGLPCLMATGVLENHGNHNPIGCDAIEATEPILRAAANVPAVVAPTVYYGPTGYAVTGPDGITTNVDAQIYQDYVAALIRGLVALGFGHIHALQVHQGPKGPQGAALSMAISQYRSGLHHRYGPGWGQRQDAPGSHPHIELTGIPHGQYDHAGRNETSWMLHLRPDQTDLSLLQQGDYRFCWQEGGEAASATAEWGEEMCEKAVRALEQIIRNKTGS
jgi:creatinine amidohydrolase/Fe(II)-dependent formamide hydrolase-like protein